MLLALRVTDDFAERHWVAEGTEIGRLYRQRQSLFAPGEGSFRLFPVGDVYRQPKHSLLPSSFICERLSAHFEPCNPTIARAY